MAQITQGNLPLKTETVKKQKTKLGFLQILVLCPFASPLFTNHDAPSSFCVL